MAESFDALWNLMELGGGLMWPLLVLSVLGAALILERTVYFARLNWFGVEDRVWRLCEALAIGPEVARQAAVDVGGLYGRAALRLLRTNLPAQSKADDLVETARPSVERFMPMLSTIITAAPLLGILGTVVGIIDSFQVLSGGQQRVDLNALAEGIAEALLTTGFGLSIALVAIFPYNALRVQVRRTIARLDRLAAASNGAVGDHAAGAARPQAPQSS